jgi:type I restriction enzyme S subunit
MAKPYPSYKPSGVAWLGNIPSHWTIGRLKFSATSRTSNVDKHTKDDELPVELCNYVDVYNNDFITSELTFMKASAAEPEIERFEIKKGDVLITKDSESWDDIAVPAMVAEDLGGVLCGYHLAIIRSLPGKFHAGYLFRLFCSEMLNYQFKIEANGVTRFGLPTAAIDNALLLRPPLHEQEMIAGYIDRETARIDALIGKKRRLLELLEEKRLAVITHAVTKGLDPNAPMKDSGEAHIGAVPQHWDVVPLRRLLDCGSGDFLSNRDFELEPTAECAIPVVGGNGTMGYTTVPNSPGGTLVIGRVGAHCGNIHLVNEPCWVTDNALRVTWRKEVHPSFMKRLLDAVGLNRIANRNAQPLVTGSMVKSQIVAVPPVSEQQALATFMDGEEHIIDRFSIVESRALQLLQEYRSALITNAVTGKIDVCGEVEKEAAA